MTDPSGEQRIIELVFLGVLLSTAKHLKGEDHSEPTWVPIDELAGLNLRPPMAGHRSASSGWDVVGTGLTMDV